MHIHIQIAWPMGGEKEIRSGFCLTLVPLVNRKQTSTSSLNFTTLLQGFDRTHRWPLSNNFVCKFN